ncbi:ATP-citrate lyase beta-subunit [Cymbomonas tetramitiformis]|uniref:ATP-citrate lyase beta-subunit n=1 Tax=Cymbomonas tetramitiformis TaxID=36881 RepID=A0AAE0LIJ0_9CHLO|nr:ATP-citrate lyase beta-subunit [Cymbomonas tetramitiformis]KAK3286487.1 ATP-citrate lyase beta-subunit [Cymbomonas tetramitiformis]
MPAFIGMRSTVANKSCVAQRVQPARRSVVQVQSAADTIPQQTIRIKLKAYGVPRIEEASAKIMEAARNSDAVACGPVPLPTRRKIFCILRSPHVNKNSMEHFEIRTHQPLIDIKDPSAQTIDALMQLDLPAGVDVEVKL